MFHYVYRLDDLSTGDFYFGSRSCVCNPLNDSYMGSMYKWKPDKTKLTKKIIKDDFVDRESAYAYERTIILEHYKNPLNKNFGVPSINGKMGGMSGEKNAFFNKTHTIEVKLRLSKYAKINSVGEKNGMWGKHFSELSKQKMRDKKLGLYDGSKNPRARKLYQYGIDGVFIKLWDCAIDCVKHYESQGIKLSRGNISSLANHNDIVTNTVKRLNKFIFSFQEINTERIKERYKNTLV